MTTERNLIQRLAGELQEWIDYAPIGPCDDEQALIDEARALLSQPEPEEPTDEELMALAVTVFDNPFSTDKDYARAVLARWGRADVKPPCKPSHHTTQHCTAGP